MWTVFTGHHLLFTFHPEAPRLRWHDWVGLFCALPLSFLSVPWAVDAFLSITLGYPEYFLISFVPLDAANPLVRALCALNLLSCTVAFFYFWSICRRFVRL